jgi:Mg2+-importing ATPase
MNKQGTELEQFWGSKPEEVLAALGTTAQGLASREAASRLSRYGPNAIAERKRRSTAELFLSQFKSPIILILVFAAILALFLKDVADASIILAIVFLSGVLGFWQEKGAADAVEKLLAIVQVKATVLRDSKEIEVPVADVVPGVVVLDAGDLIPGDSTILESRDLFVDQATLTGETFPVEKDPGEVAPEAPIAQRTNSVFMGTHVVSGTAHILVVKTGKTTEFGAISERLKTKPQETEFERGIKHFGYLLMEVTLILVVGIFALNVAFHKPVLQSFLFSLALAVGLTPQLLPAIISINLAKGAKQMANKKVIVKRLASIENFGSMNVFCADKTGTLTAGMVEVNEASDIEGGDSPKALLYSYLNAAFETGFTNPIDDAIRKQEHLDISAYKKLDEIPYDFSRKRLSILVSEESGQKPRNVLVTKGAVLSVLEACSSAEGPDGSVSGIESSMEKIQSRYHELSGQGFRTLGVAYKVVEDNDRVTIEDEKDMTFLGILSLFDPPKEGVTESLDRLERLGIRLKVVTGDNKLVAGHVGELVGMKNLKVLTGAQVAKMRGESLVHTVEKVDIFAEVEPSQKESIIQALVKAGNVVGYMGDGINDAPALQAADVGVSVDSAVDVAKEAADFVLLEKDLGVLANGVREGRTTFANTLKYVFMATSANFGNMFSMAGASIFLKFLPLLPSQVLLTNLMTDLPETTIATDHVDPEMLDEPKRWDIQFIRRFMVVFGLLSSVFDFATFGVLMLLLHNSHLTSTAYAQTFRTGWFVESVISASMVVLVIRTRRFFLKSRPSKYLFWTTIAIAVVVIALPYTPLGKIFGFRPIPPYFYPLLLGIMILYIGSAELAKRLFYKWTKY